MTHAHVPWLPTRLLHWMLPPRDRDAMLGDLCEEYGLRVSVSTATATRWYWNQVCRSVPTVLLTRSRRERWPSTLVIALGVYVLVGILNGAGAIVVARLFGPRVATNAISGAIVGLTAIASGGYVATWIRPGAAGVLGALVLIVAVVLMALPGDQTPWWYQITFLVLGPLAARAGGARRVGPLGREHA